MKERKGLHPAFAFVLMLAMLCIALCHGTYKHWQSERVSVARETQALEAAMDVRAETARNLLTVARRHLPEDDALCIAVSEGFETIRNTSLPLNERDDARMRLAKDARALLNAMGQLPSLQADSRDQMYAALMLPQALEQYDDTAVFTAYEQTVKAYNEELSASVSGWIAQLMGYKKAPELHGTEVALRVEREQTAYPVQRSYVNDDATVLSAETVQDIDKINERLLSAELTVATRHFLGGADVQEYCKGLFDYWQLGSEDVLVLLVIGEERYAVFMGEQISAYVSAEQLSSLTGTYLRPAFIAQRDYDGAVGDFLLALSSHIVRASGEALDTGGLFGTEETAPDAIFDNWNGNWWEGFFAENSYSEEGAYHWSGDVYDHEGRAEDFGSLLVLIVVLLVLIHRRRKSNKGGLGWFGWLIAISIISRIGEWIGLML